jgi:predicted DNA-binding transcriptional regulator YafY
VSNMHRIQWFDQQIREGKNPNSNHLAQQFEISKRQAQRDIEYLGVSLRAPLLYISKNRGYCYEDQTFVLPLLYMTEEEKKVLKFLAFRYKQYNYENAAAVNRVGHLLSRFTDEQEVDGASSRLPVFDADPRLMQNIQLLSHAIQECLVVHITYKHQEEETRLRICPLKLVTHYNDDYVVAFCEQQKKQRTFRLESIEHAVVTDHKFERAVIDTQEWENSSSAIRKPFTAKVLLSKSLIGGTWNGYAVRSVDDFIYDIEFYDVDAFLQHLLTSEWQQLLSPKWLRTKLKDRCLNVLAQLNIEE